MTLFSVDRRPHQFRDDKKKKQKKNIHSPILTHTHSHDHLCTIGWIWIWMEQESMDNVCKEVTSDKCRLCLLEKYFIMFNPEDATLNLRDEIFAQCMHKKKLLLSRTKTWPQDQVGFFKNLFKYPTFRFWYWTYVFYWCIPQCQQSLMIAFLSMKQYCNSQDF